jgi:hypothetical protein
MSLYDFISKLPIETLSKTELLEDKIVLPTDIDLEEFYGELSEQIDSDEFTDEKAIFIASEHLSDKYISARTLLTSKIKF